jgi:phosphohistidine phosphatase
MLRLLLLRHAKAVPFRGSRDHERALTERGRGDAALLGGFIAGPALAPRRAIHSGARRTKETLAIVRGKLAPGLAVAIEPRLYEGADAAFLDVIRGGAADAGPLLIVGHNPTIAEMARRLSGQGPAEALARMGAKFPTSALAVIDFEAERWDEVGEGLGELVHFVTPATLGAEDDG